MLKKRKKKKIMDGRLKLLYNVRKLTMWKQFSNGLG